MKQNWMSATKPTAEEEIEDLNDVEEIDNSIFFYTEVTKKSVYELNKKLKKISDNLINISNTLGIPPPSIKIHINSPGGSLLDCFAAVDAIRKCKVPVHTIIEGSAASAATLMSVVAKERSINKHAFMLIHQLSGGMWGKFEEMKDEFQNSKIFMDTLIRIYSENTKIPKVILKEILKKDLYWDAKTCLKYGLVDKIDG